MHRPLHRRRPFAAAPGSLFTAPVTPACGTAPATGRCRLANDPPHGMPFTILARPTGEMDVRRAAGNLSAGDPGLTRQMRTRIASTVGGVL